MFHPVYEQVQGIGLLAHRLASEHHRTYGGLQSLQSPVSRLQVVTTNCSLCCKVLVGCFSTSFSQTKRSWIPQVRCMCSLLPGQQVLNTWQVRIEPVFVPADSKTNGLYHCCHRFPSNGLPSFLGVSGCWFAETSGQIHSELLYFVGVRK